MAQIAPTAGLAGPANTFAGYWPSISNESPAYREILQSRNFSDSVSSHGWAKGGQRHHQKLIENMGR